MKLPANSVKGVNLHTQTSLGSGLPYSPSFNWSQNCHRDSGKTQEGRKQRLRISLLSRACVRISIFSSERFSGKPDRPSRKEEILQAAQRKSAHRLPLWKRGCCFFHRSTHLVKSNDLQHSVLKQNSSNSYLYWGGHFRTKVRSFFPNLYIVKSRLCPVRVVEVFF